MKIVKNIEHAVSEFNSHIGAASIYYNKTTNEVWTERYFSEKDFIENFHKSYKVDCMIRVITKCDNEDDKNLEIEPNDFVKALSSFDLT